MPELDTGLVDGGKLNFDLSLLQFNVKEKYMRSVLSISL